MLLHDDCGREELKESEEELGFGVAVGRLPGEEPFGDAVGSMINGCWVDPTAAMIATLRIKLSQKHWNCKSESTSPN